MILFQLVERIQFIPKIFIEVEAEVLLHFGFDQYEITEKPVNDPTPQPVLRGHPNSPHRWPQRIADRFIIARQIPPVLSVGTLEGADRADSKSIKVTSAPGRIALEIPVQRAVTLRCDELVRWQGEVVHPDIAIAGFRELARSQAEYPELLELPRKMPSKASLLPLEPGNVSVTEQGNPVRPHRYHFV